MEPGSKERLYIPQGIKHTNEKFNGIPDDQLVRIGLILGVFAVCDLIYYLISKNVPISAGMFLVQFFGTIMFFKRDENTNISVADTLRFLLRFNKSQKSYPYKALKEWRY